MPEGEKGVESTKGASVESANQKETGYKCNKTVLLKTDLTAPSAQFQSKFVEGRAPSFKDHY